MREIGGYFELELPNVLSANTMGGLECWSEKEQMIVHNTIPIPVNQEMV